MTNSVTVDSKVVQGSERCVRATVDITSYSTGGEALTIGDFGLSRITMLVPLASEKGLLPAWDGSRSSPKVKMFEAGADGDPLDELPAEDAGTIEVVVWGK